MRRGPGAGWPCLVRAGSLMDAVAQAAQWKAAGATGVLAPAPWLTGDGAQSAAPLNADQSARSGAPVRDEIAAACRRLAGSGLDCHLELSLDRVARGAAPDTAASSWLRADPHDLHTDPRTPRVDLFTRRIVRAPPGSFTQAWARRLGDWSRCGVAGYCFQAPQHLAAETWRDLVFALREMVPGVTLIVWTPGLAPQDLACCLEARFDWTVSSLAWWDGRSDWLAQECARLSEVAPVLAYAGRRGETRWLAAAAVSGDGIILDAPLGANDMLGPIAEWRSKTRLPPVSCMAMGGCAGRMTAMVRAQPGKGGVMLALSAEGDPGAAVEMSDWAGLLPGGPCSGADVPAALRAPVNKLAPAACALWQWASPMPVEFLHRNLAAALLAGNPVGAFEESLSGYLALAQRMGRRLAELHAVFVDPLETADGGPPPASASSPADIAADGERALRELSAALEACSGLTGPIRAASREAMAFLREHETALASRVREAAHRAQGVMRLRGHGDLHLGQILVSQADAYLIDFEGEPLNGVNQRRQAATIYKDLAGMLRSFDYVAAVARRDSAVPKVSEAPAGTPPGPDSPEAAAASPEALLSAFRLRAGEAFLAGYRDARPSVLALADETESMLLAVAQLEKAAYEVRYEAAHRPEWLPIPLNALVRIAKALLEPHSSPSGGA